MKALIPYTTVPTVISEHNRLFAQYTAQKLGAKRIQRGPLPRCLATPLEDTANVLAVSQPAQPKAMLRSGCSRLNLTPYVLFDVVVPEFDSTGFAWTLTMMTSFWWIQPQVVSQLLGTSDG